MNNTLLRACKEAAFAAAQEMSPRDFRHISVVTCKNRIIAVANNEIKSHPLAARMAYRYANLHSELAAYLKIRREFRTSPYKMQLHPDKLSLINFRFNNQGELRLAKPCAKCSIWCPLVFDEIYYSTNSGTYECMT